jgi:hypothetical protein
MNPPPPTKRKREPILIVEAVGFSFILLVSWGAAFFDLPHRLFGDEPAFDWRRAVVRTVVLVPIWAWVHFTTRNLLRRLRYLEEFLLVCAWCRKVGNEGQWLTMEEYFGSKYAENTSHGICPECSAKFIGKADQKDS